MNIQRHAGRIIDILSLLFCLGMAWLAHGQTTWMVVWLVAAAMSLVSAWLDTTGRTISWLRTDYVKTVLRAATVRPRSGKSEGPVQRRVQPLPVVRKKGR